MSEGDSRLHMGMDSEVLKKRSRHDDIIVEEVRMGKHTIPIRPRVASDSRLRGGLNADQEFAYDAIAMAYNLITAGLGAHATDYSANRGKSLSGLEHGAAIMASYWEWRDLCRMRHVSASMAIEIIIDGLTLRQCDAKHKMATGTAKNNLNKSLDLWSESNGTNRKIPDEERGFFEWIRKVYKR